MPGVRSRGGHRESKKWKWKPDNEALLSKQKKTEKTVLFQPVISGFRKIDLNRMETWNASKPLNEPDALIGWKTCCLYADFEPQPQRTGWRGFKGKNNIVKKTLPVHRYYILFIWLSSRILASCLFFLYLADQRISESFPAPDLTKLKASRNIHTSFNIKNSTLSSVCFVFRLQSLFF